MYDPCLYFPMISGTFRPGSVHEELIHDVGPKPCSLDLRWLQKGLCWLQKMWKVTCFQLVTQFSKHSWKVFLKRLWMGPSVQSVKIRGSAQSINQLADLFTRLIDQPICAIPIIPVPRFCLVALSASGNQGFCACKPAPMCSQTVQVHSNWSM